MTHIIGVDVGAEEVVVARWNGEQGIIIGTFANTTEGFDALAAALRTAGIAGQIRLILEPTGGYELSLALWAIERGWEVARPNPQHVRSWAKSKGRRAKTDRQDAIMLAQYGAEQQPALWHVLPTEIAELEQLLRRRDDVEKMLQQEHNRQKQLSKRPHVPAGVIKSLEQTIKSLEEAKETLNKEIKAHVRKHASLAKTVKQLLTVPGIGEQTCLWILILMHRWHTMTQGKGTAKGLTAMVGMDPTVHESGSSVRGRRGISRMGSNAFRRRLFMGALGGIRGKNVLRDFYQRLVAANKPKMVALVAAARKLLCWAWKIFQDKTTFDPAKVTGKSAATA